MPKTKIMIRADHLRAYRRSLGISQTELSRRGLSKSSIYRLESNDTHQITEPMLVKLSRIFGEDPETLHRILSEPSALEDFLSKNRSPDG